MPDDLYAFYSQTRRYFEQICAPLTVEDYNLQGMPETSPAKWHLAHTTWFFETFLLKPFSSNYTQWNKHFEVLFNSYYNAVGPQFPRAQRGILSRPSVDEVYAYRRHVDEQMSALLSKTSHKNRPQIIERTLLGIHHEQQHQELFFTDLKYCLFQNPMYPAYDITTPQSKKIETSPLSWSHFEGGLMEIGQGDGNTQKFEQFCYDNETPSHKVWLEPFSFSDRLITNSEYLTFIEDGGYHKPELWLADGWSTVQALHLNAPLYWKKINSQWYEFSHFGLLPLNLNQPVTHVSAYEADAYARWAKARLPTEFEWECVATHTSSSEHVSSLNLLPPSADPSQRMQQLHNHVWQWTSSAYQSYPGFKAAEGAIGEYNGKFMCNQVVLRGSSCVTSPNHSRNSYRNFFYPKDRWQFSGIRLAKS